MNKYKDIKLGYTYNKEFTDFKIYSNEANKIDLILNEEKLEMEKNEEIFSLRVKGNLENYTYKYIIYYDDEILETLDPYSNATNANGEKSYIIDLEKTNPDKFERMEKFSNPLDAIIYELHIRDFTLDSKNKGKFLGLIEKEKIEYLKNLGITHIQILPFYDYSTDSVDELNPDLKYNWGYDPVNYNVVEGSYSTNPNDPYTRIKELKEMINVLHKNGIRVIMDVVYNHVFDAMAHSLYKTMRKKAFRFDEDGNFSNGTACGNDVASEEIMVRKYIVDSVIYWAKEFKLDGFRFDLMGILDIDTMNEIREKLDEIDESIIILGEGWDLNTNLDSKLKANQNNANKMPNIAFFNDDIRDSIRGSIFEKLGIGFVNFGENEKRLINSIKGGSGLKTYLGPWQLIQYVEAHDNYTIFDHFKITNLSESLETRLKMQMIASSIVLTSQGIPFIHAGQEIFRTKFGVENSYNSSDDINRINFEKAEKYSNYLTYFKELISYRKNKDLFKLKNYEEIEKNIEILEYKKGILIYSIANKILIAVNSNDKEYEIELKEFEDSKIIFKEFKKMKDKRADKKLNLAAFDFIVLEK